MEEAKKDRGFVNALTKHWPQILFVGLIVVSFTEQRLSNAALHGDVKELSTTVSTLTKIIDEKIEKESERLDDEDDGVKGDMINLAECNLEQAKLRDEIVLLRAEIMIYEKGSDK